MVSFPEFKVWSLWSLLHFKLEVHSSNLNRWSLNLDSWRTQQLSPFFKLRAKKPFPSPAAHTLSWRMVKIPYYLNAIDLLSDNNRRPQCLSSFQDENVSTSLFFSSSSFKNDKQTSHHSFPLGPFPLDERKNFTFQFPKRWFFWGSRGFKLLHMVLYIHT